MQESLKRGAFERIAPAIWRDCRDSWRSLRGSPGFTVAAVGLLAFGIGLSTAVFTIINAVLYRPLPVRAPHELAYVWRIALTGVAHNLGPFRAVQRFAANADLFNGGAGVERDTGNLRIGADVEAVTGERVSANYFDVLGVVPSLGRTLVSSDAAPGAERVIVLSDALWRRRFSADPSVIGRQIRLSSTIFMSATAPRYTIVGVVGPEFTGVLNPAAPAEYWVEFTRREDDVHGILVNRTPTIGMAVVRIRPGVTLDSVRAFAAAALPNNDVRVRPEPAQGGSGPLVASAPQARLPFGGGAIAPSRLGVGLMTVAGLVLAIGAANLAGLVMARGVARRRDVAVRFALGATRWQVARQLVTEILLLAMAAGFAGLALSRVFVRTMLDSVAIGFGGDAARFAALGMPIDRGVFLFTTALSTVIGLAVGLAAVRRSRNVTALSVAAGESLGAPTFARSRRRHWITVPQLALSLALLLAALMAVRALLEVALVPSGYEPHRAAYVTFEGLGQPLQFMSAAEQSAYRARLEAFPQRLLTLAEAEPFIEAVALARSLPTARAAASGIVTADGLADGARAAGAESAEVTSSYFRVLGIPVLQGRTFEAREAATGHAVAVVDERLAARLWPGQSALGRFVARYEPNASLVWHEVVGVVGAIRAPLSTGETHPVVYFPWSGRPTMQLVLIGRGRGSDAQLLASLRDLVQRADGNIGVLQARMVSQRIDERRSLRRLAAELLAFCAIGGLALAMCGLYGVLSYAVAQRRRELGVRLALGAQRRDISLMVVKEAAGVAAAGSAAGIPLALIAMQIASHYVLPIPALDVLTVGVALLAVCVVALAACYVPARRAARVDPIDVLRAL